MLASTATSGEYGIYSSSDCDEDAYAFCQNTPMLANTAATSGVDPPMLDNTATSGHCGIYYELQFSLDVHSSYDVCGPPPWAQNPVMGREVWPEEQQSEFSFMALDSDPFPGISQRPQWNVLLDSGFCTMPMQESTKGWKVFSAPGKAFSINAHCSMCTFGCA